MKKIYLHIGMHKTGTTAIQSSFSGFDDGQNKYADLDHPNHSIPFYTAYSGQHQNYHIWRAADLSPAQTEEKRVACRAKIEDTIKTSNCNIIFSGEDIAVIPLAGLLEIRDLFQHNDFQTTVILYARDPMSFMQSALQEMIKNGTFNSVVQQPMYCARFKSFITIFGRSNIVAHIYDHGSLYGGNVVTDFARILGVQAPKQRGDTNLSLSTEAIKVKYISDEFVSHLGESREIFKAKLRMIENLRVLFPGKFTVPDELISGRIDHADATWLFSELGIDFRRAGPEGPPFSNTALRAYLRDLDTNTLSVLRTYLVKTVGLSAPPSDPGFLVARYFMSFVDAN